MVPQKAGNEKRRGRISEYQSFLGWQNACVHSRTSWRLYVGAGPDEPLRDALALSWRLYTRGELNQSEIKHPQPGHQLGPAGYQLGPAGTSWYPAGTIWYPAGTSWSHLVPSWYPAGTQLVPAGPSSYPAIWYPAGPSWCPGCGCFISDWFSSPRIVAGS